MTNRQLYRLLANVPTPKELGLDAWLRSLWNLARAHHERTALPPEEFVRLLERASSVEPPPFERAWLSADLAPEKDAPAFIRWEAMILSQIVDLHRMTEDGTINDQMRYFGIDAKRPEGARQSNWSRWYNFSPAGFLECGCQGTFGGFDPSDEENESERILVPGPVAVMGADGKITSVDPADIREEEETVDDITWDVFSRFLFNGQCYE